MSELHNAVQSGDMERVKELLSAGEDVNDTNGSGATPLHIAAWEDFTGKMATELLDHGADHSIEVKGQTPLDIAFSRGNRNTVELLIKKGAFANIHH
jgi:ankyrin repeat protein